MKMRASIIIPNYNGEGWIGESVQSCVDLRFTGEYEIIIIDNASEDRSIRILNEFAKQYSNIIIVENDENLGFSSAVNLGISLAKSEYCVLFNNDAFAKPDWLTHLVDTADNSAEIFSVGSKMIQHYNRDLIDDAGDYVPLMGWTCKRGDGLSAHRFANEERVFSVCGGAALYKKSILNIIGGFDESFFAYGEDVDIGWRANNLGYKNIYQPKAICYHIASATTGGRYNDFKAEKSGQNTVLLLIKNQPLWMLLLNAPFMLFGYFVKLFAYMCRGYARPFVKGTLKGIKMVKDIDYTSHKSKNFSNYLWVEYKMIQGVFVYTHYRCSIWMGLR